ncbi:FMN-binding glutamate synthase family protein [Mucilaginibacter segetis]|uniref:FMN-binding glutamate synthase family protein n=1 Tax=Mucilaginibacter segetis TaxID=2793071 RepID=A0A934PT15_9SPHI|nr:FMN-binding glutamate synthase family protein [Mucilaginibacter segetis]MBK0379081.1 FMN-binding glutamate synthase family protein [Mucilaginibacter segetis]
MRKLFILSAIIILGAIGLWSLIWPPAVWFLIVFVPLFALGFYDLVQTKHSITRNFPLLGHFRFLLEEIRPEIYQYFIESDTNGTPFNRQNRSLIYQRAKKEDDTRPFGTELDVYEDGYEWLNHSIGALDHSELNMSPRVLVGGPQCTQPYLASVYNISAMSFGSLSSNAVLALNGGAHIGNFAHNTGEGGLSDYHLKPGGDIIWQIGTGYFSCRKKDGTFNKDAFAERANLPQVKMIEIKLSQGAKPGHGGILPAAKVSDEIARIRLVEKGEDVISPPAHTAFNTPAGLLNFVKELRQLSGGKPVGFKLCVGHKSEFLAICKAMIKTGIYPDFITVDGGEGGTGAAPFEFSNSVGMPLREALAFVYDALTGFDLKKHIKLIASGKVATGFDLVKNFALGADMCNSARGMMFALGCIQALQCNSNTCPTGVATQDKELTRGLVVNDKKYRVANFHKETISSAMQMMGAAGMRHPDDLHRMFIYRRINHSQILTYAQLFPYIPKGSLLNTPYPQNFEYDMAISNEDSFAPDYDKVGMVEIGGSSPYKAGVEVKA